MFSFLYSESHKLRQSAKTWLELADRVHKFRRDVLSEAQNARLLAAAGDVRGRLQEGAGADLLKSSLAALEKTLRETGGRIYPANSLVENVEFFLVAAIVILGLRAYFVQPFKIPTNSMWPSYYGMTAEYFPAGEEPGLLRRLGRLVGLGATHYAVKAPADGDVLMPVFSNGQPAFSETAGRSLWVFPTMLHEYTFSVGGEQVKLKVPAEFAPEYFKVLEEAFKGDARSLPEALQRAAARARPLAHSPMVVREGAEPLTVFWVPVGKPVHRGETFLSFDLLTGDLLFVDRLTYNFFPPKVGSGFVFRTGNIEALKADPEGGDKYFVKRLVGVPGDKIEIKPPANAITDGSAPQNANEGLLYRNGKPIEGAAAFEKNARKEGLYPGYTAEGMLSFGETVTVPARSYLALGDNSPRSKDSRYWGFVPEKDVVGRPLFIYYPFTSRWGPAH
ncbi:MAG TPA: signal peptidase I [Lacunisphaera sp.]|nr:signal peptidase I [Lacunisphaera sp.]